MSKRKQVIGLMVSLGIVLIAAKLGEYFTGLSVATWYPALKKPSWTPSGSTIGLIWAILYFMTATAAWLVWRRGDRWSLWIYLLQIFLNVGWTAVFFGLRNPGLAFVEIAGLWIAVLATLVSFLRVSTAAALMIVPYLLWVSFAGVLNAMIWQLNKTAQ